MCSQVWESEIKKMALPDIDRWYVKNRFLAPKFRTRKSNVAVIITNNRKKERRTILEYHHEENSRGQKKYFYII
jgi:hypothetical protein